MEVSREYDYDAVERLQQLTSEMQIVAEIIGERHPRPPAQNGCLNGKNIRNIIRARRLREECFEGEPLPDVAWDMILDLLAARIEGERICVTSLCLASNAPQSTALRWIKRMLESGILERDSDPSDCRRAYLKLSQRAHDKVQALLVGGLFSFW